MGRHRRRPSLPLSTRAASRLASPSATRPGGTSRGAPARRCGVRRTRAPSRAPRAGCPRAAPQRRPRSARRSRRRKPARHGTVLASCPRRGRTRSRRGRNTAGTALFRRRTARRKGRSSRHGTSAGVPADRPRRREALASSVRYATRRELRFRACFEHRSAGRFGNCLRDGSGLSIRDLTLSEGLCPRLMENTRMNSPIAGVPQKHTELLKSLSEFTKEHRAARWSGTFAQFLEGVFPADPRGIARSSHQYIWDMMRSEGFEDASGHFRCQLFEDELYGIEDTLERVVDYFKAAAAGSEVGRRLLLLLGPPSGGKSSLVILLKRGLEEYSHTDAGALYSIQGCPVHESPLHLVPHTLRAGFRETYGVDI